MTEQQRPTAKKAQNPSILNVESRIVELDEILVYVGQRGCFAGASDSCVGLAAVGGDTDAGGRAAAAADWRERVLVLVVLVVVAAARTIQTSRGVAEKDGSEQAV